MQRAPPIKRSDVRKRVHISLKPVFALYAREKNLYVSDHPQEMHRSSTGFPHRAGLTRRQAHTRLETS
jgi:hypothetical protein